MMAPQAAKPIAATQFANLTCWMGSVQSGALLRRSNDSLVYPRNKNGTPWLSWRRPGGKRSALQLLDCPKAKQSSAIVLTRSVRWNLISALKRRGTISQKFEDTIRVVVVERRGGVAVCRSPWDIPPRFNDPSVGMVDHFYDL